MSILFHNAVMLLAHRRLSELADGITRKVDPALTEFNSLDFGLLTVQKRLPEQQVGALARRALEMLQGEGQGPVSMPASARLGQHVKIDRGIAAVSKFAVLGSAGVDLAQFVDFFSPQQGWLTELIRRGSPDPNLSKLVTGSTAFALKAAERGLAGSASDRDRAAVRAFCMGMLCSIASETVVSPLLRDLQAEIGPQDWRRGAPAADIAAAEALIRRDLLGGLSASTYQDWWPAARDVPEPLLQGYLRALDDVFHAGDPTRRPRGFAEFEEKFRPGGALTTDRLRDSYAVFRLAIGARWSPFDWWLFLLAVFGPGLVAFPIAANTFKSRRIFQDTFGLPDNQRPDEESWSQLLSWGLAAGSLTPFVTSMVLWGVLPGGRSPFVQALLLFVARAGLLSAFFVSVNDQDQGNSWAWWVRWLLFAATLGIDVYFFIRGKIAWDSDRRGEALVYFIQTLPFLTSLFFGYFGMAFQAWGLVTNESDGLPFWIGFAILAVLVLAAVAIPLAFQLSSAGNPISFLFDDRRNQLPFLDGLPDADDRAARRALARVFDASSLWRHGTADAPRLDELHYPPGRRVLVRMWWTGSGNLTVHHDGDRLRFKIDSGAEQVVALPPVPMTAQALAAFLTATVRDGAGATGRLFAEPFLPTDPPAPVPHPDALTDPGDLAATHAEHDRLAGEFQAVGTSRDHAYELRQTPRIHLTTRFGETGPSGTRLTGHRLVPGSALGDVEPTGLGMAADLAALLCMGAASHLDTIIAAHCTGAPHAHAGPGPHTDPLGLTRQVFRRWNLDERAVNEWRMVVAGGAVSEKPADPAAPDTGLIDLPSGALHIPGPPGGEAVANALGWLPTLRAWGRIATDVTQDTDDPGPAPYSPRTRLAGRSVQPSNRQITEAIRFLLDLC